MALIIIRGDVVEGLEFIGPFETLREAVEWIQSHITDELERCQTIELIDPKEEG